MEILLKNWYRWQTGTQKMFCAISNSQVKTSMWYHHTPIGMAIFSFHFFKNFLFEIQTLKRRERERSFYPLVHSPNGHKGQRYDRQSQEPQVSSRSPTWVAGDQVFGHLPLLSKAYLAENWNRSGASGTWIGLHIGCEHHSSHSIHCVTAHE